MSARTISARGATGVGVASLISAGAGYLILWVTARSLSLAENADFLSFWAVLFFTFGTLGGVQNEITRAVGSRASAVLPDLADPARQPRTAPRAITVGALVGLAAAAVLVVTGPWWVGLASSGHDWLTIGVIAASACLFSGHSAMAGALAGSRQWSGYSVLVASEATWRLILVLLVALVGLGLGGYEAAAGAGAAAWVLALGLGRVRGALQQRVDAPLGTVLHRIGQAMIAAASSAALMVGFPALLRATSEPSAYAQAAPLLLAISMTRAPLLMPLTAFQGVAITHFLGRKDDGLKVIAKVVGLIVAVATVGAALAWLVGPWLMVALFGPGYHVDGAVLAGLTFSAGLLGALTITGAASLAVGLHRPYALGWLAATVVSLLVLLLPVPALTTSVPLALTAGPLVGILIHAVAIRIQLRTSLPAA